MISNELIYLLIPLSCLCAAIGAGFLGPRIGRRLTHRIAIGGVGLAFLLSCLVAWDVFNGSYFNGTSIEIPLLNPNSKGHKVQTNFRGGFTPAAGTFGNSPHIIGQAVVASNSYAGGSDRGQCFLDLQSIEGNVGTCLKGYPPEIGDLAPAVRTPVGDPQDGMLTGGSSGNFGSGYGFPLVENVNGDSTIYIYNNGGP